MSQTTPPETDSEESGDDDLPDRETLAGEVAVLEEENQRLREERTRIQQTRYRQTARALIAVGVLAAVGAILFASARTVLFALAGTGVFLGILTYYLTPEQFLPATVGRDVYAAFAENATDIVGELGLSEQRVYVPVETPDRARLYVPQSDAAGLPAETALDETFVVGDHIGLALQPTGARLFAEFEAALSGTLGETPDALGSQLGDAVVEQFELAASVDVTVESGADPSDGQLTVGITDSVYGDVEQFDHPVVSFVAVGLAIGLGVPVAASVTREGADRVDALVTYRWPATDAQSVQ